MIEEHKCEKCGRTFGSEEALNMHNMSKHPELYKEPKRRLTDKQKKNIRKWVIFILVVGLITLGFSLLKNDKNAEAGTSLNFEVLKGAIHWHPKLTIKIDGQNQYITPNTGIGSAHFPIHTHDSSGILHMENNRPTKQTVTIDYFFNIWGKKFNKDCIFDYCTDKGILKMYVNGKENFDFENYFMKDKDDILIVYNSTR